MPEIPTLTAPPAAGAPQRLVDAKAVFDPKSDAAWDWLYTVFPELADFGTGLVAAAGAVRPAGTSTTSESIGTGSKALTVDALLPLTPAQWIIVSDTAAPTTNFMVGQIETYNSETGALTFSVPTGQAYGSGTKTSWVVGLSGPPGPTGATGETFPSFASNAGKMLAVNSGESATEWVASGWEVIGTASPSGAASASFTSLLANDQYSDLLAVFSLTPSTTTSLRFAVGDEVPNYSGEQLLASSTTSSTATRGSILIPLFSADQGIAIFAGSPLTSEPDLDDGSYDVQAFYVAGGIDSLKFNPASGTMSGTITLYGRR